MPRALSWLTVVLFVGFQAATPSPESPDPDTPRPIAAADTLFTEEMTWMEIRDALREGNDTVIVGTGGVEQNGPYLATGKHNYVLRATTAAIARKLGNALVAPIVPFVPEGDIDPPTGHMRYPGTISVTEETYRSLLTDICASLKATGFRRIVLIGDSGGNQTGLKHVADKLNAAWAAQPVKDKPGERAAPVRVYYIPEYYNYGALGPWLEKKGIKQVPEGLHDDFGITAIITTVDPNLVRMQQRLDAKKFSINGVDLSPIEKTVSWGKEIVDFRADVTVTALRAAIDKEKSK